MNAPDALPANPFPARARVVPAEWLDYNGHMNVAWYTRAFDLAFDDFCDAAGIGEAYTQERRLGIFVVDSHVRYRRELRLDDPFVTHLRLVDANARGIHVLMTMRHAREGFVAATNEQIVLHVSLDARATAPFPEDRRRTLESVRDAARPPAADEPAPNGLFRLR